MGVECCAGDETSHGANQERIKVEFGDLKKNKDGKLTALGQMSREVTEAKKEDEMIEVSRES